MCKICEKITKSVNRVVCDMCCSIFHVKCVPPRHKIHVPEDIHIDLFICHVCYKEDKNGDSDDENTENDEDGNEDNVAANNLFAEYLREKKENI